MPRRIRGRHGAGRRGRAADEPRPCLFTGKPWSYGDGRVEEIEEGIDGIYVAATEEAMAAVGITIGEVRSNAADLEIDLDREALPVPSPAPC